MRQAMSATRGSSGVHRPRPSVPTIHIGESASSTGAIQRVDLGFDGDGGMRTDYALAAGAAR